MADVAVVVRAALADTLQAVQTAVVRLAVAAWVHQYHLAAVTVAVVAAMKMAHSAPVRNGKNHMALAAKLASFPVRTKSPHQECASQRRFAAH